jgi:four helix bundle protein
VETTRKSGSFLDLDVYKRAFVASREVLFNIAPKLPSYEKFDLADQMRRASKAIPAMIAEGYAKKNQLKGFQKYLVDAMGEANEMIVHLSYAKDYLPNNTIIAILIEEYNIIGKQLYRLQESWTKSK